MNDLRRMRINHIYPVAINPTFDKLITALRTAVDNDGTLDKESTSYNDIFDAFRLALKFYRYEQRYDWGDLGPPLD